MDEEHRCSGRLKPIGTQVVLPFRKAGDHALDKLRKLIRSWAQSFVLGFNRRAFEGFRREFRYSLEPFRDHAVTAECGRNDNNPSHLVWMSKSDLHCYAAAHAVSDKVRTRELEILEQRRNVIGVVLTAEFSWNIR